MWSSKGVYRFENTKIAASDNLTVEISEDTFDNPIIMPETFSSDGYEIYVEAKELRNSGEDYSEAQSITVHDVIKVDPVYSINLSADFRGGKVLFSVEDSGIARVDENGKLTAVSAGTTIMYAYVDIYDAVREYGVTVTPDDSFIIGDADSDGDVTILDVTAIQRTLVSLPILGTFNEDAARLSDDEEELTIFDATFIQRWLVGLPSNEKIGTPRKRS